MRGVPRLRREQVKQNKAVLIRHGGGGGGGIKNKIRTRHY